MTESFSGLSGKTLFICAEAKIETDKTGILEKNSGELWVSEMNEKIESTWLVSEVMERFPQTLAVFIERRLGCIGCTMAPFCTIRDVAQDYHLDLAELIQELQQNSITTGESR